MKALLALLLLMSACAGVTKVHGDSHEAGPLNENVSLAASDAPADYRAAFSLLEKGQSEESLKTFDEFIRQHPSSRFGQSANYNASRALEDLGRYSEAAARYRAIIEVTAMSGPHLQAMALYRLSLCTEALDDEDSTIAVLHDLLSRRNFLPPEIAAAELPARLAGAYARAGHLKVLLIITSRLRRASRGYSANRPKDRFPEWLPRTLYEMGAIPLTHLGWNDFEVAFPPARARPDLSA